MLLPFLVGGNPGSLKLGFALTYNDDLGDIAVGFMGVLSEIGTEIFDGPDFEFILLFEGDPKFLAPEDSMIAS